MFLLRIIQFFLGSVRFSVDGGFPEKFLNLAARAGVVLWGIRRRGSSIEANTLSRNYRRLPPVAAQAGVRLEVVRRSGLPVKMKKYSRRRGLIVGFLLFFVLLWFFSSFIWTVNITGNTTVSTTEITEVLSDLGVRPGAFPLLINVREVERRALLELPDLSWLTVNITGSTAEIKVRERQYPPDVVPEDYPCNVKASQTGQVIDIQAYEGTAMLRDGDTITKGGLLISGVVTDAEGSVRLVHASGKAIARTQRELSVTVPYKQTVKEVAGKPVRRSTFRLFGIQVPLYLSLPKGEYRITVHSSVPSLFGLKLPMELKTRSYQKLVDRQVNYSKAQAAQMAADQLKALEKTELAGAKILSSSPESKAGADGYTLNRKYSCQEDIAYQEAIPIP